MGKTIILITTWVFVLYGIAFLLLPIEMLKLITSGKVDTTSAVIDIRATYGGLMIAVGLVLLQLNKTGSNRTLALLAISIILFCMAVGRVVGIFIDGGANTIMFLYLAIEILFGTLAIIYYRKSQKTL